MYRSEATSVAGFIQQLAVAYLAHGYWFYVTGIVPERIADPRTVDAKLIARYGVERSKWARIRRKQAGLSNLHYLRCGRFFVLLATHGQHPFFEAEGKMIRDARRTPVKFAGYAVSYRRGHAHVRVAQDDYNRLKGHVLNLARHRSAEKLSGVFERVPFEPYAPVRRQLLNLLRAANRVRKNAGYSQLPPSVIRLHRRIVKPFEGAEVLALPPAFQATGQDASPVRVRA